MRIVILAAPSYISNIMYRTLIVKIKLRSIEKIVFQTFVVKFMFFLMIFKFKYNHKKIATLILILTHPKLFTNEHCTFY